MGSRFAKTIEKLGLNINKNGIFRKYLDARKGKAVNHSCIYGVFCAEMEIALNEAMTHYLYAQTSAIVTNCVKTIPLSQTSGQQLLSGCYVEFDDILTEGKMIYAFPHLDLISEESSMKSCIPDCICHSLVMSESSGSNRLKNAVNK